MLPPAPHTASLVWSLASCAIDFLPLSFCALSMPLDEAHRSSNVLLLVLGAATVGVDADAVEALRPAGAA